MHSWVRVRKWILSHYVGSRTTYNIFKLYAFILFITVAKLVAMRASSKIQIRTLLVLLELQFHISKKSVE